jgi:hypothetical protein
MSNVESRMTKGKGSPVAARVGFPAGRVELILQRRQERE